MTKHAKDAIETERGTFSPERLEEDKAAAAKAAASATLPAGWTLDQIGAVPADAREALETLIRELEGQAIRLRAAENVPEAGPLRVVILGNDETAPWLRAAEIAAGRGFALAHDAADSWGYLTIDAPKEAIEGEADHKARRPRKPAAE